VTSVTRAEAASVLDPPRASVLIPARDAAEPLRAALAALAAGDYPPERLEVVVAVAPSRDATAAVATRAAGGAAGGGPRVRVVPNPRGGTSAGLNAALAASSGDVIVRLDAHALPARDYVSACVAALAATGGWAVGGPMVGVGATPFGAAVAAAQATWLGSGGAAYRRRTAGGPRRVETVYLGAWPRGVIESLGGFDEGLARNQDYELCDRIRAAGGAVWLDPAIRTTTRTRDTAAALARQYAGYGTGRAATWRRHPRSLRLRQAAPAAFVAVLAAAGVRVLVEGVRGRTRAGSHGRSSTPVPPSAAASSPRAPSAGMGLAAVAGPYALAVAATAARSGGPMVARLRVAAALVVMHLAWGLGFWWGVGRAAGDRRPAPGRGPEASAHGSGGA